MLRLGVALVEAFIANLQRWKAYQSYAQPQHSKRSALLNFTLKMKMKKNLLVLAGLVIFYIGSYILYRTSHTEIWNRNNQAYVIFGSRFSYYAFRPIAYVDGIVTGISFHIGPHQ